ncbi:hypothetical protein [Kribbella sp. NPDC000426]|uniref:hypothetical protein n=1 Tax=Kribbella sp. NPDC000426 TaxID=3154255 RepID=UPI0033170F47
MTITHYEPTHLAGIIALCEAERWPSVGRRLVEYAAPLTGALRVDLVTDTADDFYKSFDHRAFSGFRIYP